MAGTLIANTINTDTGVFTNLNALTGSAKAWVNFNGTGTVAIRDSFNVSSITDNGTGDYTINFTTAMPNANYSVVVTGSGSYSFAGGSFMVNTNPSGLVESAPTTTAVRCISRQYNDFQYDAKYMNVSIFSS
jgi:hypothetical protein